MSTATLRKSTGSAGSVKVARNKMGASSQKKTGRPVTSTATVGSGVKRPSSATKSGAAGKTAAKKPKPRSTRSESSGAAPSEKQSLAARRKALRAEARQRLKAEEEASLQFLRTPVDLRKPRSNRPLTGEDVRSYVIDNKLERIQAVEALALASPGVYTSVVESSTPLPFEVELLLRFYFEEGSAKKILNPIDVFNIIYGDLLAKFVDTEAYEPARIMLLERFSAMLGRTVYTGYRWFKRDQAGNYGKPSSALRRLFARLPEKPAQMRAMLERLAGVVHENRGVNFEVKYPLPDPKYPPKRRSPGPARIDLD